MKMLTDEKVNEFRELYKEEFNEELSLDEAREVARNLLDLYLLLIQPTPKEKAAIEKD